MSVIPVWSDSKTGQLITRCDTPSEQTISLLENTIWGSSKTRYRILGLADKLARLRDPTFFVFSEYEKELSVFVLDFCHKQLMQQAIGVWHFVMAATVPDRQNEGIAAKLIDHVRAFCVATVGSPGIGFAYVEASTEFSLRLSEQIGYSVETEIPLTLFSRLVPRANPSVGKLEMGERGKVLDALEKLYADHELTDFETSLRPEAYLVFRQGGLVAAGAQIELLRWSVQSMPGLTGWFFSNLLSRLPGLKRFLNLSDLRIVRFSNVFAPQGAEAVVLRVLETALAQHSASVGLIMMDKRSPVLKQLLASGNFGMLSGALKGSAKLHIDVVDMAQPMLKHLRESPLLISAGDVI